MNGGFTFGSPWTRQFALRQAHRNGKGNRMKSLVAAIAVAALLAIATNPGGATISPDQASSAAHAR
jgi:hypothetical protein